MSARLAKLVDRLRWRLAYRIDNAMPSVCWSDLCDWPLNPRENSLLPLPRNDRCKAEVIKGEHGIMTCFCGKVRTQEAQDLGHFTGRPVLVVKEPPPSRSFPFGSTGYTTNPEPA